MDKCSNTNNNNNDNNNNNYNIAAVNWHSTLFRELIDSNLRGLTSELLKFGQYLFTCISRKSTLLQAFKEK